MLTRDLTPCFVQDRCGGTLCQSMVLHSICCRIRSLLAGDAE